MKQKTQNVLEGESPTLRGKVRFVTLVFCVAYGVHFLKL